MKREAYFIRFLTIAVVAAVALGLAGPAPADSKSTAAKAQKDVVTDQTVVKTSTLYSFPKPKTPEMPAAPQDSSEAPAVPSQEEYRIGPGDVLDFQLFDDTAMSREVKVRYDGQISLPLISDIKAAGLTRAELLEQLNKAYEDVYKKPHIALTVKEVTSRSFYVLGAVEKPAEYPYTKPLTVLEAFNLAGGPRINTQAGDSFVGAQGRLTKAFVIRRVNGKREVYGYDLSGVSNSGENPSDSPVLPGDVVYVPEGLNLVYVMGEAAKPGVFPLSENMTLLQLLGLAGGALEKTGRMRSVLLLHQVDAENTQVTQIDLRKALDTGYSPRLEPGDIIYVPRSGLVRLYDNLMRFTRLTETVSPLLGLYTQGMDSYYRYDLYKVLLDTNRNNAQISVPTSVGTTSTAR